MMKEGKKERRKGMEKMKKTAAPGRAVLYEV